MNSLRLPRLASWIAIAMAVVCGGKSVHAGVITESSWGDTALVVSAHLPTDAPQRDSLRSAEQGGLEALPASSSGGSQTIALPATLIRLIDASVTGRLLIVDFLLPDDPFLKVLPKPA